MKTMNITELLGLARSLGEEPVALLHQGRPVAVFLPVRNADLETVSLSFNPEFLAIIERSRASYSEKGGSSSEELRKEFGLPPLWRRSPRSTFASPRPNAAKRPHQPGNGEYFAR
jgi:hypothetical protein